MESATVEEVVIVDRAAKARAMQLAEEYGVEAQIPPSKGFEPVATVTLVLLGVASAVATVVHLIDKEKGGQVIDLRHGAVKAFYRSEDVTYGLVVVIAKDGSATVEVKEPKGMFGIVIQALMETLVGLGDKKIEDIASTAKEVVGDKATVVIDSLTR